jgi:hypothetical protein
MESKLKALNTIALWLIVFFVGGYLIFKPSSNLDKETVTRLTAVVDKLGVASENMTKLADSQRDWFNNLQQQASQGEVLRNNNYGTLYEKYGYKNAADTLGNGSPSLDDLYHQRVLEQTDDLNGQHLRGVENPDRKDGAVQKPNSKPKEQSH